MTHSQRKFVAFAVGFAAISPVLFILCVVGIFFGPDEPLLFSPGAFLGAWLVAIVGAVAAVNLFVAKVVPCCIELGCDLLDRHLNHFDEVVDDER